MSKKYTLGPWTQGRTLRTGITRTWSEEAIAANDVYESMRVYANFNESDGGKGRQIIAVCENKDDASLIADAGTTYYRTSLTPSQLMAQREQLVDALIDLLDTGFTGGPQGKRAVRILEKVTGIKYGDYYS
jgi:hypothetical protein